MDNLKKEMYLLTWQFCRESNLKDAQHELERVTGCIFDAEYFSELIRLGDWKKLEEYLLGFTQLENNPQSADMFFAVKKQRYMEAIERGDKEEARRILENELAPFEAAYTDVMSELARLLWCKNLRNTRRMRQWRDVRSSREALVTELAGVLRENPDICNKLEIPKPDGRFGDLAHYYWKSQYGACRHLVVDKMGKRLTLLKDHDCPSRGSVVPVPERHPQPALPSSSTPVSEGMDLGLPGPSQGVNQASDHLEALALVPHNHPEPETLAGENVEPSSPQAAMSKAPPPLFDLNCLPEEYIPEDEEAGPSGLPPVCSSLPSDTPASLAPTESESSSRRMQKRIRSNN